MAYNPLLSILFIEYSNPPYVPNDKLIVYYEDVSHTFYVTLNGLPLTDPLYNIALGQPWTKDSDGYMYPEYIVDYLDAFGKRVGGFVLNGTSIVVTTPTPTPSPNPVGTPYVGQAGGITDASPKYNLIVTTPQPSAPVGSSNGPVITKPKDVEKN